MSHPYVAEKAIRHGCQGQNTARTRGSSRSPAGLLSELPKRSGYRPVTAVYPPLDGV
ncbi:hypothetical protein THTE_1749 [Thermogutta terrifontis]|uniref:Uncharacterized protein n=1 Tax=Thermogutta terrifontis TaxID=1331910 RepID=A0A286REH5_9BACT|nr:hypothetical protein THTE_1749 [Thermogutta terrifontis]